MTISLMSLALAFGALAGGARPARAQGPGSLADLSERLIDAVVNISTTQRVSNDGRGGIEIPQLPDDSPFKEFFDEFFKNRQGGNGTQRPRKVNSLGSGFVIDPQGIIVTNNHVIADADEIVVNFNDGTKLDAELIGRDDKTDVALLRVKPDKPLKAVSFGESAKMRVGDWVLAIGNPFGLGGTVTAGIISAVNRDISSGPYDSFIQTDASINRGNSGGPLFNMDGEVVGINTAIISPSGGSIGIGFAVPSDVAKQVIAQLQQYGETRRGWLGVRITEVTNEIAESLGMDKASGALVGDVTAGGPAEEAGLQRGDVILEFDGRPVESMRSLPRMVANTQIGKDVEVVVLRQGERKTLSVKLGRLEGADLGDSEEDADSGEPAPAQPDKGETILGMNLKPLDDRLREQYGIGGEVTGIVIASVDEDSVAAEKQVKEGDVIVQIGQEPVETVEDIETGIADQKDKGRSVVLLTLTNKDGDTRFVVLPIK
ncbi:MAG: Do family serine endopeptidase [Flavobacteriaceae bacterium]